MQQIPITYILECIQKINTLSKDEKLKLVYKKLNSQTHKINVNYLYESV